MNYQDKSLQSLKLGQATEYAANYDRTLLQPVPRKLNRDGLGITEQQPFTQGADIWTAYEIESKSFKLYLNSFNQSKFADFASVERTMREDLSACAQGEVKVCLHPLSHYQGQGIDTLTGDCIDDQDIEIHSYEFNADILQNCPIIW